METAFEPELLLASGVDLRSAPDEQLVVLARDGGHRPARDELLRRLSSFRRDLIRLLARDAGLDEADRMEAQQDAVLWTLEAIRKYHGERPGLEVCHFRTFLHRVIRCRFVDSVRRRIRYRTHFVQFEPVGPSECDEGEPLQPSWELDPSTPEASEVVEAVEGVEQVRGCLAGLPGPLRRLFELLAEGLPLKQVAVAMGISYAAAKRRRRNLLARLHPVLGRVSPP